MRLTFLAFLNAGALWLDIVSAQSPLPTVDLGYEVHQALNFNVRCHNTSPLQPVKPTVLSQESSRLYTFRNIRYAQPPVGDLRWALPLPPSGRDHQVQNGSTSRVYPQGLPRWFSINSIFSYYFRNNIVDQFNYSSVEADITSQPDGEEPGMTDDCLFLDAIVPEAVLSKANTSSLAPVMVWFVFPN